MKLIIEIDLYHARDYGDGKVSMGDAAKLVECAAEKVRGLDVSSDMLGCSYRLRDESDDVVGSITVKEGDGG